MANSHSIQIINCAGQETKQTNGSEPEAGAKAKGLALIPPLKKQQIASAKSSLPSKKRISVLKTNPWDRATNRAMWNSWAAYSKSQGGSETSYHKYEWFAARFTVSGSVSGDGYADVADRVDPVSPIVETPSFPCGSCLSSVWTKFQELKGSESQTDTTGSQAWVSTIKVKAAYGPVGVGGYSPSTGTEEASAPESGTATFIYKVLDVKAFWKGTNGKKCLSCEDFGYLCNESESSTGSVTPAPGLGPLVQLSCYEEY